MLRMLTVSRSDTQKGGRWDKASEITARLKDTGYKVSVRTVQRDLNELSEIFPIELNDKNPRDYGWRWLKGANLDIPGMSVSEALAMRLVETHLKPLLPAAMLVCRVCLVWRKPNWIKSSSKITTPPRPGLTKFALCRPRSRCCRHE
jgi:hypothetical protein